MTRWIFVLATGIGALACGSSDDDDTSKRDADCRQGESTKALSVIDRSYDDVSGAMSCKDSPIQIYAGAGGVADATGLVTAPTGTPIATARTAGAFAEFELASGEYIVCLAYAQPSCGKVNIAGKHVYGIFTGGPRVTWSASEDAAAGL